MSRRSLDYHSMNPIVYYHLAEDPDPQRQGDEDRGNESGSGSGSYSGSETESDEYLDEGESYENLNYSHKGN